MKLVILCDVDGVIADFEKAIFANLRLSHGLNLDPAQKREFNFPDAYPDQVTPEIWADCVELICQRDFCATLAPYEHAVSGVQAMMEVADVHFVTSPWYTSPFWMHERTEWLCRQFGQTQGRKVIHTRHKHLVRGSILIEDKPNTLDEWIDAQMLVRHPEPWEAILWSRPYNTEWDRGHRCATWGQVLDIVEGCIK